MVAYNFKEQFAFMVASGQKRQTIRASRKRHVMPGEAIQLYTGMRTKACRKLVDPDPICTSVIAIRIDVNGLCTLFIDPNSDDNGRYHAHYEALFCAPDQAGMGCDQIARDDGFSDFTEMKAFFQEAYGLPFLGVLIKWEF
jgi:hypothetical protein